MDCDRYLELMSAALDGELSAGERRELDSHLAVCPACAALFEQLSGQSAALRELDCEPPAGLTGRVMANLPEQKKPGKSIHWKRWGSLAACLILVAAVGILAPLGMRMGSDAPAANKSSADLCDGTLVERSFNGVNDSSGAAEPAGQPDGEETEEKQDAQYGVTDFIFTAPNDAASEAVADPQAAPADTRIFYSRLPEGWEDIVETATPQYALLSGREALAFLALLEEQNIPYTVDGDETFSGDCQLVPAEE